MKPVVIATAHCMICRETYVMKVYEKDFEDWLNGKCIQYAFPYLSNDFREILKSGICGPCFDKVFK